MDSADLITLMLIDKGYYDYDYQEPKPQKGKNISKSTDPEKLKAKLARLGVGVQEKKHPLTPEQLQAEVMEEERKKQQS